MADSNKVIERKDDLTKIIAKGEGFHNKIYEERLEDAKKERMSDALFAFTIPAVVFFGACLVMLWMSWSSYADLRAQYDATVTQYKSAVTMYEDRADLNIEKAAFTDFKYQGYQENIAGFVKDLRYEVVSYNKSFIKKKIYDDHWFFGLLIIGPDKDMKVINMLE
jgi:hypothetical protein